MDAGVAYFPTHDGVSPARARPARRGARPPLADVRRAHAHPRQPRDAVGRREGAPPLPRKYAQTYDPFVAIGQSLAVTSSLRVGHRHLPRHPARPDHHRQGGREPRPPLGRPLRLRHRRGLEPRGDGEPRHRPAHAHAADARARAGDEGDLDRSTRRASTASSSTSTGSGRTRSRSRSRTRRSSSAATARRVFDRVIEYGDAWMPNHDRELVDRIAELREQRRPRGAGRDRGPAAGSPRCSSRTRTPASSA